jgi:hypothetical protein
MKRYIWIIGLLLLLLPLHSWAASPDFLIMDQLSRQVIVMGSDFKPLSSFKAGPSPTILEALPEGKGYGLLCKGSKNLLGNVAAPGELLYLDSNLKPTQTKITFPGLVIQDYYFKSSANWIVITQNKTANSLIRPKATVTLVDLKSGSESHFEVNSIPTTCQINSDRSLLALTVLGSSDKNTPAQCLLIDLNLRTMKAFPVSSNPGGVYFINEHQIMVACGGFGSPTRYSSTIPVEHFDQPVNASLHWIDTTTGEDKVSTLGYSPMVVVQDQKIPDTFYVATSDKVDSTAPQSTISEFANTILRSEIKLPCDIVQLVQVKDDNICLYGRHDFYIVHFIDGKILNHFTYDLDIDNLLLNQDRSQGYVSAANSNYIDKIDLSTGVLQFKFKMSSSLFGGMGISSLFAQKLPPVTGMVPPADDQMNWVSSNHRILMTDDGTRLYALASRSEVSGIDLSNGLQISSCKFNEGKPFGIHFTPDKKMIAVETDTTWYLVNPEQKKPAFVLSLPSANTFSTPAYYSPDGTVLVIPNNGYFYFVDYQNSRLIGKLQTSIQNAVIAWLH